MFFWQTSVNNDMIFPARRGLRIMLSREYKQNTFSFMFDAPCQEDPRLVLCTPGGRLAHVWHDRPRPYARRAATPTATQMKRKRTTIAVKQVCAALTNRNIQWPRRQLSTQAICAV